MRRLTLCAAVTLLLVAGLSSPMEARQDQTPLTNNDVIKMVKAGVPETAVVASIKSRPAKFDISPDALIALHKAGVTQDELNAMIAAAFSGGDVARGQGDGLMFDAVWSFRVPPDAQAQ